MKTFKVIVPEKRQEIVNVVYHIEAESIDEVDQLFDDIDFFNHAEYMETLPNKHGFEVVDYYEDKRKVEEISNDTK
jgi:hypothetical protein